MGNPGFVHAVRADGTEVPVEASISHVRTPGGELYTAVLRDITERLRVEEEIRSLNRDLEKRVAERTDALTEANRQLSALVRELEAFSYSVSHDLRAPLRAIGGFSRMVVEDEGERLTADGRRVLDVVERNARRMGQLIDDLLALARINRSELERRPTDLAALAADVVAELAVAYPGARVDIGALPRIEVDPTLARQALLNVVGNALKYSGRVPEPRVEIGWDAGLRAIRVKDNGVGFDMRFASKLFGMFQRLHSDPQYEGTGVGLAIVKRVVERHGGRVWAQSAEGEGATFYLAFGADDPAAAPA
jgi:signal transduction histidine kinase